MARKGLFAGVRRRQMLANRVVAVAGEEGGAGVFAGMNVKLAYEHKNADGNERPHPVKET